MKNARKTFFGPSCYVVSKCKLLSKLKYKRYRLKRIQRGESHSDILRPMINSKLNQCHIQPFVNSSTRLSVNYLKYVCGKRLNFI